MRLQSAGTAVFNIWMTPIDVAANIDPGGSDWEPLRLTRIANTTLGAASFLQYFPAAEGDTPMQEQFDTLLLLGPRESMTFSPLSPELCTDEAYLQMRARQLRLDDPEEFGRRECKEEAL